MIGARDHVGQRVLFYHVGSGRFAVASKAAALLRLGHIPAKLDEQSIADFLYLLQDPEATFFEGIRRLPAGHLIVMARRPHSRREAPPRLRRPSRYSTLSWNASRSRCRCSSFQCVLGSATAPKRLSRWQSGTDASR